LQLPVPVGAPPDLLYRLDTLCTCIVCKTFYITVVKVSVPKVELFFELGCCDFDDCCTMMNRALVVMPTIKQTASSYRTSVVDPANCSTMNCRPMPSPNALAEMVTAPRVRWDAVLRRLKNHPEEALSQCPIRPGDEEDSFGRIGHDRPCGGGNTVLHLALCRPYDSYYPSSTVVEALVRACPEAAWIGISTDDSPLHAACRRRATLETLRVLMDARPSVPRHDSRALLAFWESCSDLFGGDAELVRFCHEAHDREASSILVRLYHLLRYCTAPPDAIGSKRDRRSSVPPTRARDVRNVGMDSARGVNLDPLHPSYRRPQDNGPRGPRSQDDPGASGAVSPRPSHEWHAVNAAASLPLAPVGMLDLFLGDDPLVARLDRDGWSALHHAAAIGNAELPDVGQDVHDVADDEEQNDLPCVGKVRRLVDREPRLCRLSDRGTMRLPIHVAAASGLPHEALELLFREWPCALLRRDGTEGLYPALLAAAAAKSGGAATLDCLFRLLLASPQVLCLHR
jgi:hypothetical protein